MIPYRTQGLALAEEFGHHGAKIVLTARNSEELERARLFLERMSVHPNRMLVVPADLRRSEDAESLMQRATEYFGRIDIQVWSRSPRPRDHARFKNRLESGIALQPGRLEISRKFVLL